MNVKRYFAKTARDALRELKAELGADAIVLSNRAMDGGVEILALPAEAVGALQTNTASSRNTPTPARAAAPASVARGDDSDDYRVSLSSRRVGNGANAAMPSAEREPRPAPAAAVVRPFDPPRVETADYLMRRSAYPESIEISSDSRRGPASSVPAMQASAASPAMIESPDMQSGAARGFGNPVDDERIRTLQDTNRKLMEELSGIRGMIERQLAGFAWGEVRRTAPARAEIVGELLEAGFSSALSRSLADTVSKDASLEEARASVRNALGRDLRAMSSDADLIDRGGVFALVGPTGVGKTTTTAKIAARFVVRHGADKLALITTDGYRIGAQEQLRIYGRILGVPVFPVRDGAELRQTLSELRNKHMVLIDTVGMSQRDRMVAQQAAMLAGAGSVRRLLLLNATCRGDTLDDVIRAYKGPDLAGCVFTKVDEAASLAPAIGAAIAHELDVVYVTNGQRVPEDLHLPNRSYLLHRALKGDGEDSPWHLRADEAALMMAAAER